MISTNPFVYQPNEHEAEKASSGYLMSLIAVIVGLPIPVINLFATFFFYVANRNGTYFVRWHTTQALLSQLSLVFINSYGFWWTISIIFGDESVSNNYISYIVIVLIFNLTEFIATIYSAVQTRKGKHIHWWLYGDITDIICKPGNGQNSF